MTTATMEMPATTDGSEVNPIQMGPFQTGVLNGRKDVIILLMGFIYKNQQATRDDIWDFVMRIETIIRENPTAGIVELSALANETEAK